MMDESSPSSRFSLPRRGPWLALASIIAVALLGTVIWPTVQRWHSHRRAGDALARLRGCLIGNDDAATMSDRALRLRAIAASLASSDARWPDRCNHHAAELSVALGQIQDRSKLCDADQCCVGDAACSDLDRLRELLEQSRLAIGAARFADGVVMALFEQAAAFGIARGVEVSEPPPAPATLFAPATLTPLARMGHDMSALSVGADDGWRLLLHTRGRQLTLCELSPQRATARCNPVPTSVPVADSVLLVDGSPAAPPHLLARRKGGLPEWSVYDARSGEPRLQLSHDPSGVAVFPDGRVVAVVRHAAGFRVVGAAARPELVDAQGRLGPPLLYGSTLMWPIGSSHGVELRTATVAADASLGPVTTAVTVAGWRPAGITLQACRSTDGLAVVMVGDAATPRPMGAVAFVNDDRWTLQQVELDSHPYGHTCEGDELSLSWVADSGIAPLSQAEDTVRGDHDVRRQRCTRDGCNLEQTSLSLERWSRSSRYLVGSVGGSMAVIWRSGLGDVRFRLAPAIAGATSRSHALFDVGGEYFAWEDGTVELLARDGRALLLVPAPHDGGRATFAFVIDERGARPVTVHR